MRSAAASAAAAGADLIDLNMGCPVRRSRRPARARRCSGTPTPPSPSRRPPARAPACRSVKLRAEGVGVAHRLVDEAGVAGITFHPRTIDVATRAARTTTSPRGWSRSCRSP